MIYRKNKRLDFTELRKFRVFKIYRLGNLRGQTNQRAMKMRDASLHSPFFVIYDGRLPEANISEILKFQSLEKTRNAIVEICPYN